MSNKVTGTCMALFLAIALGVGAYYYPGLPAQIPSHWSVAGQVNGMLPKFWAMFLSPLVMVILFLLWAAIPFMEPLQANLEQFRRGYNGLFLVLQAFFLYEFLLVVAVALGHHLNIAQALAPALVVLMAAIGYVTKHSKRNFFVGIRTPWTLASDTVWHKTHELGSKLFYLCAVCIFFGIFFPGLLFILIVFPFVLTALTTVIYSYIEFRHERV
jgi:uncharacterized membrane protein